MPAVGLLDCLALNCQLAGLFAGLVAAMWLAAQLLGKAMPRLLELFSGTGSIGRAFREAGWKVTSLDLEPKFRPDILCDVLRWDFRAAFPPGHFDMVWSSPPCTEYSGRSDAAHGALPRATPRRIACLDPPLWVLKNPQTGHATNAALSASETSSRAPSTQSSRGLGGLHNLGARSRKQRRSQPAFRGSSLLRWPTATGAVSGSSKISGAARRVHGDTDGLGRSNRSELRSHGRHADDHQDGLAGPLDCESLDCTFTACKRRSVDGQRGLRRRDERHSRPRRTS